MRETDYKAFDAALRVVDAKKRTGRSLLEALVFVAGGLLAAVALGYVSNQLIALVRSWTGLGARAVAWLLIAVGLLLALGFVLVVADRIRDARAAQRLLRSGTAVKARLVGREHTVDDGDDVFYVYYQYMADFAVRFQDETLDQTYYNMPQGAPLNVLYDSVKTDVTMPQPANA